jgi:hypothetical protein
MPVCYKPCFLYVTVVFGQSVRLILPLIQRAPGVSVVTATQTKQVASWGSRFYNSFFLFIVNEHSFPLISCSCLDDNNGGQLLVSTHGIQ